MSPVPAAMEFLLIYSILFKQRMDSCILIENAVSLSGIVLWSTWQSVSQKKKAVTKKKIIK